MARLSKPHGQVRSRNVVAYLFRRSDEPGARVVAMVIEGVWANAYGSVIEIVNTGQFLAGLYRSHTGSSGIFRAMAVEEAGTANTGNAAALIISWRSVGAEVADAGSHWMSGLSGQILTQDGEEVMILSHVLVATSDYAGVAPGSFIDKLTYRRATAAGSWPVPFVPPRPDGNQMEVVPAALDGDWYEADGSGTPVLQALSCSPAEEGLGLVTGGLRLGQDRVALAGFVDLAATRVGLDRQAISLVARWKAARTAIALSGWLDMRRGTLELTQLASTATTFDERYLQTRASFLALRRVEAGGAAG